MSIWYDCGNGFVQCRFARCTQPQPALICCPGPSLTDVPATLQGPGRTVVGINTAYPKIRPDLWFGMDDPRCYDGGLWHESFLKFMRGNYSDRQYDGHRIAQAPFTYFMDVGTGTPADIFTRRAHDIRFYWDWHTLGVAVHALVWLGYKQLCFVGCDMGGVQDYYDARVLTKKSHEANQALYAKQVKWLQTVAALGKTYGVSFTSCTPVSPLNTFMPFVPVAEIIDRAEAGITRLPVLTAIEAEALRTSANTRIPPAKLAVVVPTRGDRPQFLAQCREMLARQTVQPATVIVIDRPPSISTNDQRERVAEGVAIAAVRGCEYVAVVEDDDYYPPNYLEMLLQHWNGEALVGGYFYDIYHIGVRKHVSYNADMDFGTGIKGAPLHSTAFSVSTFNQFMASGWLGRYRNLDEDLWGWAQAFNIPRAWIKEHLVLSIKHNVGMAAGGNHASAVWTSRGTPDPDLAYLRTRIPPDLLEFYRTITQSPCASDPSGVS